MLHVLKYFLIFIFTINILACDPPCPPPDIGIGVPIYKVEYFAKVGIFESEITEQEYLDNRNHPHFKFRINITNAGKGFNVTAVNDAAKVIFDLNSSIQSNFPGYELEKGELFSCGGSTAYKYLSNGSLITFEPYFAYTIARSDPNRWYFKYQDKFYEWNVTDMNLRWADYE